MLTLLIFQFYLFLYYSIDTANLQVYGGFYNSAVKKLPHILWVIMLPMISIKLDFNAL